VRKMLIIDRRSLVAAAGGALGVLLASSGAFAQGDPAAGYPKGPIKMIVGFAPGGGNDIIGRIVAQKLTERLGQPAVVENRVGAGGIVAAEAVARSAPDGLTILIGPVGTMIFNPVLFKQLPYDPEKSFKWITMVADYPLYLSVLAKSPFRSVKDLVDFAKANPAQANYASTSGVFQLTNELFKLKTGTAFEMIPFKGSNEMIQGVLTGQATMGFIDPSALMPQVKAGTIRILASTGARRKPDLPDIPTMAEAGVQGVVVSGYTGLQVPAATPDAIVLKLEKEVNEIIKAPDVIERFKTLGVYAVGGTGAEQAAQVTKDLAVWRDVVKKANIPLQ
jgi:tripartite-type tricarboxylate transporter receptor subunit TctC